MAEDIGKSISAIADISKLRLTKNKREQTFMDITGFPHYENVCSNILQFYLDPNESHGMEDLFYRALMITALPHENTGYCGQAEITREALTHNGNRIDLVIETDAYIIGVENKIYSGIGNDLADYDCTIKAWATVKNKKSLLLLLTLLPTSIPKQYSALGIINITHLEWVSNIEKLLGDYAVKANPKYLMFLIDFIKSQKNLSGGTDVGIDLSLAHELEIHKAEVRIFFSAISDYRAGLRDAIKSLGKMTDLEGRSSITQWFYRESGELFDVLVHDVKIADSILAIDTSIDSSGWQITVWYRKNNESPELRKWLKDKNVDVYQSENPQRFLYKKYALDADIKEIAVDINSLIVKIIS